MPLIMRWISPAGFLAAVAAATLAVAAVGFNIYESRGHVLEEARRGHELHARLLAENVAHSMGSVELLLDEVAASLTRERWWALASSAEGHRVLQRHLKARLPQLRHLLVFDADGVQRHVSFATEFKPVVVRDRP